MATPAPKTVITARAVSLLAIQIAVAYANAPVLEEGGNNRGDQVEFFQRLMGGKPGDAWCADFVCTCLVKGYARAHGLPEDRIHLPGDVRAAGALMILLSGDVDDLRKAAIGRYRLRSKGFLPSPGDLVLYDFNGTGVPHHVGFVRAADSVSLATVEGNTSSGTGSQSDGDGVYLRTRDRKHVFGFVSWS